MTDSLLTEEEVSIDPNKNYLEDLVGDGKKFKSAEELAKGKYHADQTIETYKRRMDELRQDYLRLRDENVAKARLEELIDQLGQKKSNSENTPAKEDNKPALDEQKLESLLETKLVQFEAKKKSDENFKTVQSKLKEQYGDNYSSVLRQRSEELGLTTQEIDALARRSPTAFMKALDLEPKKQEQYNAPMRSQRNDNFAPSGKKVRDWAYYQEMKKTKPDLYYDPKIGVQMAQDAVDLGEAFRTGDYYVKGLHE